MRCKNSGHNVFTGSYTAFLFFLYIRYNATQDEILSSSDLFSLSGTAVLVQIFLPGSKSAPDMPFLLVHIKHLPDAMRKVRVDLFQTVGAVFMFGRYNLERFHFLQLIQIHLSQDHQASVNKYLHFHPYLLLSSESTALTADWSSDVHL